MQRRRFIRPTCIQLTNLGLREMAARLWFLGPVRVGGAGLGLVGAEIFRGDVGEDEVLGWDGAAGETPQEGELTGMRHGVGEGPLEEDFGCDAVELGAEIDVFGYVGEDLVEVRDSGGEVRQYRRAVVAPQEIGAGGAQAPVHVTDELMRCSNPGRLPAGGAHG